MITPSGLAKALIVPALLGAGLLGVQGVLAAPPTASFTVDGPAGNTCGTYTFTSTSSDPDNDIQTIEWDLDGNGTFEASGSPATVPYATAGTRNVTLRVTDAPGGDDVTADVATTSQLVAVQNEGPPNATSVSATPNPAQPNQAVTFTAPGTSDSGSGSIAKFEWDLDGNGSFETDTGTTNQATQAAGYPTTGFHSVGLRVTDNCGAQDTSGGSVFVSNSAPTASFTVSPNPAEIGATVSFNAAGSTDPGGSIAKYEWDLDGDDTFELDTGTVATTTRAYAASGTIPVHLRVTDNGGATAETTRVLRINAKPTASFSVTPNPALINETVTFNAESSGDPDGSIASYQWDLDGNGSYETNSGAVATATKAYGTPGTVNVKLRVTDNNGAFTELTRPVTIQLTRPNPDFAFSPADPLPGQTVTLVSTSTPSASPGAPQLTDTQWDFDYSPLAEFSPDAAGASATTAFSTPGAKTVAIKVIESGGGFAIKYLTIVVNAPPQASFTVTPDKPVEGNRITFASTAGDPDGPLAAQQWDLDNDGQFDDASGAVASTTKLKKGNRTVKLRVTDSKGATAVSSQVVPVKAKPLKEPVDVKRRLGYVRRQWGVEVVVLIVKVPSKTTVAVTCKGRGCPRGKLKKRSKKKGAVLRFTKLKGSLRAGAKITIVTSRPGHFTAYDTYTIRGGRKSPLLREACKAPGSKKVRALRTC